MGIDLRRPEIEQQLRNLLLGGAESPPAVMTNTAYFETLRA